VVRRSREGGFFVSDGGLRASAVLRWVCILISKWVARGLPGGHNSNFGKLRLAVCTVRCLYGSTDMGELGSVGKRWTVHVIQRALCPPVYRSSGGQARSATVGVAHSSYRPVLVLRFSSTLVILWNSLPSLVTVGYVFFATNLRFIQQPCSKLCDRYIGPFLITEEVSPVAFRLKLSHGVRIHDVVHANLAPVGGGSPGGGCTRMPAGIPSPPRGGRWKPRSRARLSTVRG
jgi:hypothetical protein